ncbi:SPOR domain-containing protein [Pseudomonadota bacterium]
MGAGHARESAHIALPIVLFLLALIPPLQADYQTGLEAYQQGNFETAITEWQKVAESPPGAIPPATRAETLYAIGMLYWLGQGVQQDTTESASWLKLAAELNHPGAQTKLGFLYSTGQGVKQSNFEALKWWQMAANQSDADAQYNLGVLYRDGLGVKQDANQSLQWFREAAANGDALSVSVIENFEQTGSLLTTDGVRLVPVEVRAQSNTTQVPAAIQVEAMGENWIRQRKPENYTIQVVALSQPDKLEDYIQQHPDWAPFAIYGQTRYEQPLWVLVQGDYSDVGSARQAVHDFPQDMQQHEKLWIRRFQIVQGLLE